MVGFVDVLGRSLQHGRVRRALAAGEQHLQNVPVSMMRGSDQRGRGDRRGLGFRRPKTVLGIRDLWLESGTVIARTVTGAVGRRPRRGCGGEVMVTRSDTYDAS